jgi:GDP-D-mannose dehydratase
MSGDENYGSLCPAQLRVGQGGAHEAARSPRSPELLRREEVDQAPVVDPREELGWKPCVAFVELIHMMADADLKAVQMNEAILLDPVLEMLRPILV